MVKSNMIQGTHGWRNISYVGVSKSLRLLQGSSLVACHVNTFTLQHSEILVQLCQSWCGLVIPVMLHLRPGSHRHRTG